MFNYNLETLTKIFKLFYFNYLDNSLKISR